MINSKVFFLPVLILIGFVNNADAELICHSLFQVSPLIIPFATPLSTPIKASPAASPSSPHPPPLALFDDVRAQYELLSRTEQHPLMKIGEGNSAISYLSREADGEYVVIKIYKPAHLVSLKRDHEGLQAVQDFFIMDKQHSPQLQVVASQIVKLDNGTFALKMPFVPGVNLHKFLVETAETNPLRQVAVDLYNQMISELHRDAQRLGLVDEVRVETDKYFQDHKIDGLMMLRINGNPSILIKSDNVIFNPAENSLTLIDPY